MLTSGGISSLYAAKYFHNAASIRGRFYSDYREAKLKPGYVMGWLVKNIMLVGGLESILEGISDVRNTNGEVSSVSDSNNQTECRCCYDWVGVLVKVNPLHFRSTISAMEIPILVDDVNDILD